jgi:hypothetical protein
VEKCNGMACGLIYFFLYDIQNKKTIIYHQLRNEEFSAGYSKQTGNVELLVTGDMEYFDEAKYVLYAGRIFTISQKGIVEEKRNKNNKPFYFKGYRTFSGIDTLNITEENFR